MIFLKVTNKKERLNYKMFKRSFIYDTVNYYLTIAS